MAKQKIVWTAVPYGRVSEGPLKGALRISVAVSPRLTPVTAAEQKLGAPGYAEFHDWPQTLSRLKLQLQIAGLPGLLPLQPLQPLGEEASALWRSLFDADTPVAGFRYTDMSRVNLRSYPVRNLLGFLREHYGKLAVAAAGTHPTLLPWRGADPTLKGMLTSAGTRTYPWVTGHSTLDLPLPGFDRFFDDRSREGIERQLATMVFGTKSRYRAPVLGIDGRPSDAAVAVRALPPDWADPAANGPDKALMDQFETAAEYTLYQANRFYRRTVPSDAQRAMRRPDLKNLPPALVVEDFDFHRIVASLADTPAVLRALGLIIDCALPADNAIRAALAQGPLVDGVIGLEVAWGDPHNVADDAYPRTAFRATASRFLPRERTAEHAQGLMRLGGSADPTLYPKGRYKHPNAFDVYQLDPDGAALKTTDFVLTAQNLVARSLKPGTHGEVAYTTGDRQPVAALRSGGLGVSRHGRAGQVAVEAAGATLKNAAIAASAATTRKVLLFAEDLLRGYRVDVQHRGKWHSLCRRVGDYRVQKTGAMLPLPPDEGYVKGASTTGDGGDDHYLHETVFRWTGWSLAAPRPGRRIAPVEAADSGLQGEEVTDSQEAADNGNGLAVRFRAQPGTLPRLRFGQDYRLRARVVDLAGNSLALDEPGDLEEATEAVSYLRFEPLDPPALVHRHRVSEGESLERMVLRSNYNADPKAYLATAPFKAAIALPASADFEYVARNERHVVPPKSSQLQCEQHGLFDAAFGGTAAAIKAAYRTAAREAGTLYDTMPGAKIELITPASVASQALTTTVPPALPSPQSPTGGRLVGGQYVVHREERLVTPYLPDGAAGGFTLRGDSREDLARIGITQPMVLGEGAFVVRVPQTEELVLIVENGKQWPDTQGFRLVIDERPHTLDDGPCAESFPDDGRPKWDAGRRVLTLVLRKGHIVRLRYASFVDKRFIDAFGLPRWSDSAGQRAYIAELALHGVHWMITPYRPLVLVHATQQPVCTPRLQKVSAPRRPGETFTDLDGGVQLHGPSTGKFEVVAEWHEWVDDPQRPRPVRNLMRGTLGEIPLPENHVNEFMLASAANAVQLPPAIGMPPGGDDKRTRGNRHEFGDTKFRLVKYRIEATTRFREYLPVALHAQREQITRLGDPALESRAWLGAADDPGAPVLFDVAEATPHGTRVRSTQVPEVPRVVYSVPTFRWQRDLAPGQASQSSTRLGNGLRVYVERPWFSSGDGELLGVVLLGDGARFDTIPEAMMPFVTQWGLDPLFDTVLPKEMARASDFSAQVASETLPLLENGSSVHVVGHRVQWDDARKLWFCDIVLDAGWRTYMPFVRLALVRYQPHSIKDMKISRVTLAEFAQVLPRRAATLQRSTQLVSTGATVSRAGSTLQASASTTLLQRPQTVHTVKVRGPVPERGPMVYTNDSAHLGISFLPMPGSTLESGRNKFELVLQTRSDSLDSDLAWSDVQTLASALALPPGATVETVPGPIGRSGATAPPSLFDEAAQPAPTQVTRSGSLGELQRFEDHLALEAEGARAGGVGLQTSATAAVTAQPGLVAQVDLIDPVIWQATVTVPAFSGKGRLVLREFERYYTDRTVPDRRGDTTYRRRVVEERLVYSEFFALN